MHALYLAPFEGTGSMENPFRAKYSSGAQKYGGIRSSRQWTLAYVESTDSAYFTQLAGDLQADGLLLHQGSVGSDADQSAASQIPAIAQFLGGLGLPSAFLTKNSAWMTHRQVAWYIASLSLMPQRFEAMTGSSMQQALLSRGSGANDRAKLANALGTLWQAIPQAFRDQYAAICDDFVAHNKWSPTDYNAKFANRPISDCLLAAGDNFSDITLGPFGLSVPISQNFTRMFAYGDRSEVANDDFSTDPFAARWQNGEGTWNDMQWSATDYVEESTTGDCAMRRANSETFSDDQYSSFVCQSIAATGWMGACVRRASGTDESGYHGYAATGTGGDYRINETDSSKSFTLLGSGYTQNFDDGDTLYTEVEGTTIRIGSIEGGGSDTDRSSGGVTDATLTTGDPGLVCLRSGGGSATQFDSWSGGDITAAGGGTVYTPAIRQNYRNMDIA